MHVSIFNSKAHSIIQLIDLLRTIFNEITLLPHINCANGLDMIIGMPKYIYITLSARINCDDNLDIIIEMPKYMYIT